MQLCEPLKNQDRGERINLTESLLKVTKDEELTYDFDVKKYSDKIKDMASELEGKIENKDPEGTINEINTYLFQEGGFRYNDSGFFLNEVLDDKKGNCVGLSNLYLVVSENLGLPIHGVSAPRHMFIRWEDKEFKSNIELTNVAPLDSIYMQPPENKTRNEFPSDGRYIDEYNIPQESIEEGVYLKNLSKKEVISTALNTLGTFHVDQDSFEKAIEGYDQSIDLNPNNAEAYFNRGTSYMWQGDFRKAEEDLSKSIELNPNFAIGYIHRGLVNELRGYIEKATEDFYKAKELNPDLTCRVSEIEKFKEDLLEVR